MMRFFIQFAVVVACVAAVVGCSDAVAPLVVEGPGFKAAGGQIATVPVFIEIGGVDGEVEKLEEAMELYVGTGAETTGLLLPAIQKVREAMAELEVEAGRDGSVNANQAEKAFRKLINTHKPKGDAYSIQEICGTSATEGGTDTDHKCWIIIESKHKNASANVEYQLHHFFNGARLIMDAARVNDDAIDRAMDNVLASIADLSDVRP